MNIAYNKNGIKVIFKTDGNGRITEINGYVDEWNIILVNSRDDKFKIGIMATPPFDLVELRRHITCHDMILNMIE